jgi:acetyltransferase
MKATGIGWACGESGCAAESIKLACLRELASCPDRILTAKRVAALFKPASLVLVGASDVPGTLGDVVRRNLLEGGFAGPIHYVNLRHEQIDGRPVHRSVLDLPEVPELAVVLAPAARVPEIIGDCGRKGIRAAVVVSAGFREGGVPGAGYERQLRLQARKHGLRFLGPNSLGVIRTDIGLNASCGPGHAGKGRLALVSDSGALCAALLDWAGSRRVGFSSVISTGMGSDVEFGEILDYLARDPATDSIMLYMEGLENARRFVSALRAAARVKPVVVMKAGRHVAGPGDTAFHTGALVGADDVFEAAMRRAGVLRIRDFSELYTAAATLGAGVRVRGRRLAIVSNAGGPGTIAADRAQDRGLQLARLGTGSLQRLAAELPPAAREGNPVFVRPDVDRTQFAAAMRVCLEDPEVDALLAILVPHALTDTAAIAGSVVEIAKGNRKPVFTCWMGGTGVEASRARFAAASVPNYMRPETAIDAIAGLGLYAANQQLLLQTPEPLALASAPDRARAQAVIDAALAADRDWLNPAESKEVLDAFGIPVVRSLPAHSAAEAAERAREVGFPVAMKILSPDITHKTDVNGVRLNLVDERDVRGAYSRMLADVAAARPDAELQGVLIEPMYREQNRRELMIGVVRDPVFGPAISFGLGGIFVEVIRDRAVALPPLNQFLVHELIRRTRAGLALQPLRGAPAADEDAVEQVLLRVSEIVCELPTVGAMDINPLIVTERGAVVVDARIGVLPPQPAALPYDHMAIHPYPSGLRDRMELPGGLVATIRPIRPEDAAIEAAFVHGLSEQSKFLRFMFGLRDLTPAMLSRFTQIDYDRELALIAVIDTPQGEQQIGVVRYTTLPDEETCEFAIVVGDDWQGKGLARRMFTRLIEAARERRLKVMTGVTLRENARMIDLSRSLGFETRSDPDDPDLVQMTLQL